MKPKSLLILGIALLMAAFGLRLAKENISETRFTGNDGKKYATVNSEKSDLVLFYSDKVSIIGIGLILIGSFAAIDTSRRELRR